MRAYEVIRWTRAVDHQTVFAQSAAEAKMKAEAGEVEDSERTGEGTGIRSVRRFPEMDEACREQYG